MSDLERSINETLADGRDAKQRAARERAERRERIATAVVGTLLLGTGAYLVRYAAVEACDVAGALMLELDARLAADLEAAK